MAKLGSLSTRAISVLSHSSLRSARVSANANAPTAAPSHTLNYYRYRGDDPGYFHQARSMKSFFFCLIIFHFVSEGLRIAAAADANASEGFILVWR